MVDPSGRFRVAGSWQLPASRRQSPCRCASTGGPSGFPSRSDGTPSTVTVFVVSSETVVVHVKIHVSASTADLVDRGSHR